MLEIITQPMNFLILLTIFTIGAIGSLVLRKNDVAANWWSAAFAIAGSGWGLFFAVSTIIADQGISFIFGPSPFPLLTLSFHIDLLAAFFIFIISLITLFCSIYSIGYIKHFYQKYNIGLLGFFYHSFAGQN